MINYNSKLLEQAAKQLNHRKADSCKTCKFLSKTRSSSHYASCSVVSALGEINTEEDWICFKYEANKL